MFLGCTLFAEQVPYSSVLLGIFCILEQRRIFWSFSFLQILPDISLIGLCWWKDLCIELNGKYSFVIDGNRAWFLVLTDQAAQIDIVRCQNLLTIPFSHLYHLYNCLFELTSIFWKMESDLFSKFSFIKTDALISCVYFIMLWTPSYGATSDLDNHTKGLALVYDWPAQIQCLQFKNYIHVNIFLDQLL